MQTNKFHVLEEGTFKALILITNDNPNFNGYKLAAILPFNTSSDWETSKLNHTSAKIIQDAYVLTKTDEEIQNDLIKRAKIIPLPDTELKIIAY